METAFATLLHMEERIREVVGKALAEAGAPSATFSVEWPADPAHGDFATNAAMAAAKVLGRNPKELAEELAGKVKSALSEDAADVSVAGPGFVNITLASAAVRRVAEDALTDEWGNANGEAGLRVMIEYGNPNPFKEMHIGHMMGAIIGESISRLSEAEGAKVLRDTFGGDVGPQVAKALWALMKDGVTDVASAQEIGKAYIHGSAAYEESETAKKEIDDLNVRIYRVVEADPNTLSGDDRALLSLWRKGREVSMEEFNRIFALLGTRHDYAFFDSETTAPGMTLVNEALAKGVLEESEGAIVYKGEKKGLHTLVFVTSRGTPTYETKDFGLALIKEERAETDQVIIVTAIEQVGHFKVVLAALEDVAPALAKKTTHVAHGLLTLTTGKMSSRKGNVITAAELIREVIEKASEKNDDPLIAEQVAIGALKYMILRSAPGANVVFDPEKSLSLDGDSGPYLQYALVRAKKLLASDTKSAGDATPTEPYAIERLIIRFPAVVARAAKERAPHHLTQYLTQLAAAWNSFYANEQVLGSPEETYKLRIANTFANTMTKGLTLLGIPTPERM